LLANAGVPGIDCARACPRAIIRESTPPSGIDSQGRICRPRNQAVALLCEFSRASPGELDDEAKANATAVTRLAALLPALAEAAPGAVANQISLLRPFLACSSASMRGAVLSAVGTVLVKVRVFVQLECSATVRRPCSPAMGACTHVILH
jgi:hypothetical protein